MILSNGSSVELHVNQSLSDLNIATYSYEYGVVSASAREGDCAARFGRPKRQGSEDAILWGWKYILYSVCDAFMIRDRLS